MQHFREEDIWVIKFTKTQKEVVCEWLMAKRLDELALRIHGSVRPLRLGPEDAAYVEKAAEENLRKFSAKTETGLTNAGRANSMATLLRQIGVEGS